MEVRTPQELDEALANGAEAILLDNMTAKQVKASVERIKKATAGQLPLDSHRSLGWHRA